MAPINHVTVPSLSQIESLLARAVIEPTRTLLTPPSLAQRQASGTVTVLAGDGGNGGGSGSGSSTDPNPDGAKTLTGGAIAGIVIGSIAGFLLLVWIFRSCSNLGAPPGASENPGGRAWYDGVRDERPARHVSPGGAVHRSRSRSRHSSGHHHHRHHHHHGRRSSGEMREVEVVRPVASRSRSPRAPPVVYDYGSGGSARRDRRSRDRGY